MMKLMLAIAGGIVLGAVLTIGLGLTALYLVQDEVSAAMDNVAAELEASTTEQDVVPERACSAFVDDPEALTECFHSLPVSPFTRCIDRATERGFSFSKAVEECADVD